MDGPSIISDRLFLVLLALLANALFLGPRPVVRAIGIFRPAHFITHAVRSLERRLNRDKRSEADRTRRGYVITVSLLVVAALSGAIFLYVSEHTDYAKFLQVIVMALLLSVRQTADLAAAVAHSVEAEKLDAAKAELAGTAWRNAPMLDIHGLCRAGIETLSVHLTDRIVSPTLWYLLLGLPGLFACAMLTVLADATAHARAHFGKAADQIAGAMHYLPSLVSGGLAVIASFALVMTKPKDAANRWLEEVGDAQYRRRGPAVFGASLGVALGGPGSVYAQGAWVGGANARMGPQELRYGVMLFGLSVFLYALLLLLFFV